MCDSLNEHDKVEFMMDIRKVDFGQEGHKYQHGLAKYWLFEDIPSLTSGLR